MEQANKLITVLNAEHRAYLPIPEGTNSHSMPGDLVELITDFDFIM